MITEIGVTVSGGNLNSADGLYSSVSGGSQNHAIGAYSSVSGGYGHNPTVIYGYAP
jgi:hypothetical protein